VEESGESEWLRQVLRHRSIFIILVLVCLKTIPSFDSGEVWSEMNVKIMHGRRDIPEICG
jgi:hypothetical protein